MALLVAFAVFIVVASIVTLFGYRRYVLVGRVYENIGAEPTVTPIDIQPSKPRVSKVSRLAEFVGGKLPPKPKTASTLQLKLLAAGYRAQNGVAVLYGLKLLSMAIVAVLMTLLVLNSTLPVLFRLLAILVAVLAGYRLPDIILARRIVARKKKLRRALPDALDLIVVCAEAGLTIDRCFRNVSHQLGIVHPELCDEFRLFTAEISAGLRRRDAMENIADRTQEPEIRKFVQVLIQADRFGTSMADALRTHAEYLRVRRRQDAEEKASKLSVKLIFPIFFFIMPCMILVTVGPAAVTIARQLSKAFGGH